MKNFTFKKEWLDEMSQLPVDFQAAVVLAANKYAWYGEKPSDAVVAYAMRHIIAYIDRRNAAESKRSLKVKAYTEASESELVMTEIPVQNATQTHVVSEGTEEKCCEAPREMTLTEKRYQVIKKKLAKRMRLNAEEQKIYRIYSKREAQGQKVG